jgi:hypothetical protein
MATLGPIKRSDLWPVGTTVSAYDAHRVPPGSDRGPQGDVAANRVRGD